MLMSDLRLKAYPIIERAVEEGVRFGYNRAHKHTDTPSKDHFCNEVEREVMNALCEVIDFTPIDPGYGRYVIEETMSGNFPDD